MALLDAGFPSDRFKIDAVDVSANALVRATNAIYGNNSFRGKHLEFRDRYFVQVEDGYALSPDIQRCVIFQRDNVLRDGFRLGARYDFIFCRNLLIYFDRAMQGVALDKIRSLLATDGVLFVGPAEMPIVTECGFASANISHAFASRKKMSDAEVGTRKQVRRPLLVESSRKSDEASPMEMDRAVSLLVAARQFADAGQLTEAATLCERHIQGQDTCAEGYYLMGLVKDAANDPDAITYYRKAIYLDPNHYEALIHAALWLEKNGDVTRSDAFKRRAERVCSKPQAES
jgi:chemotaxis protein methyltransferase WspC